jgi:hypothetical protein
MLANSSSRRSTTLVSSTATNLTELNSPNEMLLSSLKSELEFVEEYEVSGNKLTATLSHGLPYVFVSSVEVRRWLRLVLVEVAALVLVEVAALVLAVVEQEGLVNLVHC